MMRRAGDCHDAWRALPVAPLDTIIGAGSCLVMAPHPDDESLGCGGLIAACCAAGRPPLVTIVTDGAASHPGSREYPPDRLARVRAEEARHAVALLGVPPGRLSFQGCPDSQAPVSGPAFKDVVTALCDLCANDPTLTTILASWRHDPHCDHEATAAIADAVATRTGLRHVAYPVWGWTLPAETPLPCPRPAGWQFDVSSFLYQKKSAIRAHASQYGGLIADDQDGFRLPPALLATFDRPYETFLIP